MRNVKSTRSMLKRIIPILMVATIISGCAANEAQDNPKKTIGTLLGAGVGALIGAQMGGGKGKMMAVAVGALAGAWFGSELGKSLDKADKAYMERSTQDGLEYSKTGSVVVWNNPDSGNSGNITPSKTYQEPSGRYCREFQQTIFVDGQEESAYGRACRNPDGSWEIVGS